MSARAEVLVCSIADSARRTASSSRPTILRPPRACSTVTAIACETMSCSSRAIRARSAAIARAFSSCRATFLACSSRSRSPRSRTTSPAAHGIPQNAVAKRIDGRRVIAVADDEGDHRGENPESAEPRLDPSGVGAEGVEVEQEDHHEHGRSPSKPGAQCTTALFRSITTRNVAKGDRRRRASISPAPIASGIAMAAVRVLVGQQLERVGERQCHGDQQVAVAAHRRGQLHVDHGRTWKRHRGHS